MDENVLAIPFGIVEKLVENVGFDEVVEVTPVILGDRVVVVNGKFAGFKGEIVKIKESENGNETCDVEMNDGIVLNVKKHYLKALHERMFPYSGFWAFGCIEDERWLAGNIQSMADCGFRVYEQEDYGYIFGIDGTGYNFLKEHWVPPYKARGLHWHKDTGAEN